MSDEMKRWYCLECKREYVQPQDCYANSSPVSITGNPINGSNCQYCGSPEIQLIKFRPKFPGLDIPRDGTISVIPSDTLQTVPGRNTSQEYSIRTESKEKKVIPFNQIKPEQVEKDIEESIVNWTSLI